MDRSRRSEDYIKSTAKSMFSWKITKKKWSKCEKSTLVILSVLPNRFYDVLCEYTLLFMLLGALQVPLSSEHDHFWARHVQKPAPKLKIWSRIATFASKNHQKCSKIMFLFIIIFRLYYPQTVSRPLRNDQNLLKSIIWEAFRALNTPMQPQAKEWDKQVKSRKMNLFWFRYHVGACWGCMDVPRCLKASLKILLRWF